MSLALSYPMFLIGTIGTLLIAIIIGVSSRRYRRELIEAGGAQTTLGSIGCVYLEGKALAFVVISIGILVPLIGVGSVGLLILYIGFSAAGSIVFVFIIAELFLLAWFFCGPGDGKARLVRGRVLRSYWSHRNKEILRLELVVLSKGDKTKRRALELIAKRGCKASLVAREVIAGTA